MVPVVKNPPANAGDRHKRCEFHPQAEFFPRLGRSPGVVSGNPLQYACLENDMDGAAWQATVHGGHKESDTAEHNMRNSKYRAEKGKRLK